MPAKLDRCVQRVMAQGRSESDAFAICRTTIKQSEESEVEENTKEKKRDENGNIIVAENVKFYLDADIKVID